MGIAIKEVGTAFSEKFPREDKTVKSLQNERTKSPNGTKIDLTCPVCASTEVEIIGDMAAYKCGKGH